MRTTHPHVLMLGPTLDCRGGINSVLRLMLSHADGHVRYTLLPTYPDMEASRPRALLVFLAALLRLVATSWRYDCVHIHMSQHASTWRKLICIAWLRLMRKPICVHLHASHYDQFWAGLPSPLRLPVSTLLRRCDRVLVLSHAWFRFYRDRVGIAEDRLRRCPNPTIVPDQEPTAFREPEQERVVGVFLGVMGERKGIFDLLDAIHQLPDDCPFHLIAAGSGVVDDVRSRCHELGIDDRVEVHGWLNPDERDAVLGQAAIYLLPSYQEGLPMSILEAMAQGLPVISTPVGGIPDAVNDGNGRLVPPGDVAALRQAIIDLCADPALRRRLGRQAWRDARGFDIDPYMRSMGAEYRQLIGARA